MQTKRLAVLVSETGSIMESIVEAGIVVSAFIADRPCKALDVAAANGWRERYIVNRKNFKHTEYFDRVGFTTEVMKVLFDERIDLVMMAGFKTVLYGNVFTHFDRKILNTHPSLLPAFKGKTAVRDAFHYGSLVTGCTLHYATCELDQGPIVDQRAVRRLKGDTIESLHERIKVQERKMVVQNLRRLVR